MKTFKIKSIVRAAALYHLYYNMETPGKFNPDDICDFGSLADQFQNVENRREYRFCIAEFNEVLSPESINEVNNVIDLINSACSPKDLSINDYIGTCALNAKGKAPVVA